MLHFKRLAIGVSLLLALSFFPASTQASDYDFLFEQETLEARLDPRGYCDLFWGGKNAGRGKKQVSGLLYRL